MITPSPLNWGFLSTARINNALMPPLSTSDRNRLLAVASRTPENAKAYAEAHDIPRAYGSYEALLADPEIDVIYNPLPNHLHAEWTVRALHSGKHVLCEKPFVLTLAEMDAIEAAVQQTGRVAVEAFMYRSHAQTRRVQELVRAGAIGEMRLIKGAFSHNMRNANDYRWDPAMGGGSLWDVGCYPVNYARAILGVEPVEAFAWQKMSDSGVDGLFSGMLRFPGEVFLQFDCAFEAVHRSEIEIVGSQAALRIPRPFAPGAHATIYRSDDSGDPQAIEITGNALYVDEVEDIADAILLGKPPTVSLADSRANTRTLLALLKSAGCGRPVSLTEIV